VQDADDPPRMGKFRQRVAPYEPRTGRLGRRKVVGDLGVTCDGGIWLGATLILLHGGEWPVLTAFQQSA
jgi:hypothetical protein